MNYFLDNPIPTAAQAVRGYADGGAVGVSSPFDIKLPGGSDKPLMEQLYEQGLVDEDEYMSWLAESSGQAAPGPNIFVDGATTPESSGIDYEAMARAFGMLGTPGSNLEPSFYGKQWSLGSLESGLPVTESRNVKATPAAQLSLEELGLTREEADKIAAQYDANKAAVSPLNQLSMAEIAQQAGVSEADLKAVDETFGETYRVRNDVLSNISDLLQKNDFKGAFDLAIKAENEGLAGGGLDFFDNVVNPNKMRYLRGPMTKDEIRQFYEAIPQDEYIKRHGKENMFILQQGIENSLAALGDDEVGYVDPRAALMARPNATTGILGDLIAAGFAMIPGIGIPAAMAISGAQKYVTSGGNLKSALLSAAMTGVGMKVGEAIKIAGAPGVEALGEVTTTASKAAAAAAEAASNAVASGVAPGALAEIVVTAARQAAPNLAQGVIGSVTGSVLNQLAAQGVEIPQDQLQQAREATQRGPAEQAQATANVPPELEEVVVQSLRRDLPVDLNTLLASTTGQGVQDILSERQIAEQQEIDMRETPQTLEEIVVEAQRPTEFDIPIPSFTIPSQTPIELSQPDYIEDLAVPEEPLEEVVVQSLRRDLPVDLNTLLANVGTQGAQDILSERQIQEQQELEAQEEPDDFAGTFEISTDRLPELNVGAAIPNLGSQLYDSGYKPPGFDDVPVDDLAEIVVRGSKPTELDLFAGIPNFISNVPDVLNPDVKAPAEYYPDVEEVVVEGRRPVEFDPTIAVPDLSKQFEYSPYDKPAFEDTPLDEIVVEGRRPTELDLVMPPFDIPKTTTPDVPDFPEGPIEEIIVEGKRPEDLDLVAPPFTIPGQTPVEGIKEPEINKPNKLKELLGDYGSIENLIKLIGAIGGAAGSGKGTGSAPAPAYDPRGSAGTGAWIDWEKVKAEADAAGMNLNTYTARNWNRIQNRALEAGVARPPVPSYNTPGPGEDMQDYLDQGLPDQKAMGGMAAGSRVRGPGSGREDLIPALLSDGEYVIDAETMALLGDGSVEKAADMMDDFRQNIRKHKGATLAKGGISPNAKSPLQYLRGK
jgi:hypothetical protein